MKFADDSLIPESMISLAAQAMDQRLECLIIVHPAGKPLDIMHSISHRETLRSAALMVQCNIPWLRRLRWLLFGAK